MAENFQKLKTIIALKQNTYQYWTEGEGKDYIPLYGEVCICEISDATIATTAPTVLFKVGTAKLNDDGTYVEGTAKKFSELNWVSAAAADVFAWAKESSLFVKQEGTGNVVSGIVWDATLNNGKGGIKFTTAAVATAQGLEDLQNEVYGEGGVGNSRIDALEALIAENAEAWAQDNDTTYTFAKTEKGFSITPKNGTAQTITFDYLTQTEVEALIGNGTLTIKGENGLTGTGTFGANQATDATITISHGAKPTTGTEQTATAGEGRSYITKIDVDAYGHIANVYTATESDQAVPEYSIVKDATSEYAATYHLQKDGVNVGSAINIPKDMVVESGEVKALEEGVWGEAGTYIILTLSNATNDKLYINVGTLIEYVTGGTTEDIVVSVDPITHVATATLTAAVKSQLAQAHTHTNKAELDKFVTGDKDKLDTAVQQVVILGKTINSTQAELTVEEAKTALGLKDAAYNTVASIQAGVIGTDTDDAEADTVKGAKTYAMDAVSALAGEGNNTTVKEVADKVAALEEAKHISGVEADTGLKVVAGSTGAQNKVAIDTDVVFILDCNF